MSDDIEVPRRGYDTKDVETMSRALASAERGGSRRTLILVVLLAAAAVAVWLMAGR